MNAPVPAGHADIPELVALVESAYRGDPADAGWTTEAAILRGQRIDAQIAAEMIDDPVGVVLLSRSADGRLLGSVQLRDLGEMTIPEAPGASAARASGPGPASGTVHRTAYFGLFSVAPRAQGNGLGSALMADSEAFARRTWGATRMRMTVISVRTDLIAYYERRGYRPTGEVEPFPYGDERFGIPQRDDLEFAVLVKDIAAPAD